MLSHRRSLLRRVRLATPLRLPRNSRASLFARAARFPHSQAPGKRGGVTFVNESPKSFVEKLRKRSGKNIWLMGGGELARDFLKEDLVDELYIGIVPVLIGEGIPLFPSGFPQREFTLLENK